MAGFTKKNVMAHNLKQLTT